MKYNTKVFEGLFDKFGTKEHHHHDVLAPIKREIQRFLSSRQKSLGKNLTCIASDYGVPEEIWEKSSSHLDELQTILTQRLQQLDPRCKDIECTLDFENSTIKLTLSLTITPPRERIPVRFIMLERI